MIANDTLTEYYAPARLPEETAAEVRRAAETAFAACGCRDYARFDFRADSNGEIKLLDVNPNPGWCWHGKVNLMAGFAGMRYSELLGQILGAAVERLSVVGKSTAPQVEAAQ